MQVGSSASQARGVTGARRAPTSSVRVRDLAGLLLTIVACPQLIADFARGALYREGAACALRDREEAEMHLHLVRVAARPQPAPRPAKVVQLEVRREARLEAARRAARRPRPAA